MKKTYTEEEFNKDWEELCNISKRFIRKYYNPHTKIIIDQTAIVVYGGEKAKSFIVEDDAQIKNDIEKPKQKFFEELNNSVDNFFNEVEKVFHQTK